MEVKLIDSLLQIDEVAWNNLAGDSYPFMRYEFLSALEQSGSVSAQTGWTPRHLLVFKQNQLIASMPLYLKTHSSGEYVFDHQWANAYHRYGLKYYPKCLSAVPFTPCQGPRLITAASVDQEPVFRLVLGVIEALSQELNLSSWHCLFPNAQQADLLSTLGLSVREGVQFQWFNKGYRTFDDFLQTMTASKRKMLKRERRKVNEAGIELIRLSGNEVSEAQWRVFFQFYQMTYLKKGMRPYLNLDFFLACSATLADKMLLVLALKEGVHVGSALSFIGAGTLYGRYWGCREEYDFLHFETCYYQGLEFCIEHGLNCFDSGAQGEHKIARGFEPVTTYSAHWFKHNGFAEAVGHFVTHEKKIMQDYKQDAASYLPFKK